jgi:RNA polymerase sigma factor (sigma-70 family)
MTKHVSRDHSENGNGRDVRAELEQLHGEFFGWALHCCSGRGADAEEVLQSAYLKVLSGRARFAGASSFKTWLMAVIRNIAADEQRRAARGANRLSEYRLTMETAVTGEVPGVELERHEEHTALTSALAALPSRQQEVLRLMFYHGLSVSQAAEAMGVSVGTARTHYERAKQQLRESLVPANEHYERRTT